MNGVEGSVARMETGMVLRRFKDEQFFSSRVGRVHQLFYLVWIK
ncbi:hypothetical protein Echvi_4265 [Echinicola vietnamensis DSM 17526]|uniref:Uncharacterized protein n=1 Tax=Echinicola vietnamensis (strain DSM 17526 / LMG 23754 / KMM 6221) TaxID=926556 RepID=L0G563_ECHVK|nr:hypothetical protein Echvi_4265 [Echinicola vietnamensis DSM 17526]